MGNLTSTREKNIIEPFLLEKNNSINEINKGKICKLYTIQDLYDITSIKNGTNIHAATELIFKARRVKVFLSPNENIRKVFEKCFTLINLLGLNVVICSFEDGITLKENETVLIFKEGTTLEHYESFLSECEVKNVNVINILSEKDRIAKNNSQINLYRLDYDEIDRQLSLEILLNCVYFAILVMFNTQLNCKCLKCKENYKSTE